jgi:hypothetical protein
MRWEAPAGTISLSASKNMRSLARFVNRKPQHIAFMF